jgi:hypothetical protein
MELKSKRRKSINFFSRSSHSVPTPTATSTPSSLAPIDPHAPSEDGSRGRRRLSKRSSIFGLGTLAAEAEALEDGCLSPLPAERGSSPGLKQRTLKKKGRSGSVFGSLGRRSNHSVEEEDGDSVQISVSATPPDMGLEVQHHPWNMGKTVLHHGEVQTTTSMFRKKKEYVCLTETHILRFKSQARASEVFPSIRPTTGRATRHPSTASIGSLQEVQSISSHASAEFENGIALKDIVTAYKVEDGRPFFVIEVVYLDEVTGVLGSMSFLIQSPYDADLWHTSIRAAAEKARIVSQESRSGKILQYIIAVMESRQDYTPEQCQIFRVVRRSTNKSSASRSSSDDLAKLSSSFSYMVIGINKIRKFGFPMFW